MSDKSIIGLSRLVALQHHVDRIARNIANQTTAGFKSEGLQFQEYLSEAREELPSSKMRSLVSTDSYIDFSSGPLTVTGNGTDVAIVGDAFFVVQTNDGERYTRRGAFAVDQNGRLVTPAGEPVLSQSGVLTMPKGDGPLSIKADGTVSTAKGSIGRLRLVRFDDLEQVRAVSGGLFVSTKPVSDIPVKEIRLVVGAIEGSNVKPVAEMTKLIAASRAYEDVAKAIFRSEDNKELKKLSGEDS
ncbi:flagellar basal-body rod protein FlgF [Microbacteriaceae bacterium K1510]|nr:flagellar basal-body rod protein FlgF [Microbacteriaceae bacterium K1510]